MNRNILLAISSFLAICMIMFSGGCGGAERLKKIEQDSKIGNKYEVFEQKSDNLESKSIFKTMFFYDDGLFTIGMRKYENTTSNENFATIVIRYMGRDWLFLNGEVRIKVDGELSKFKDDNPTRFVRGGSRYSNVGVTEEVAAWVPWSMVKKMATGKDVAIHSVGEPIYLNEKEKSFIIRFYNENSDEKNELKMHNKQQISVMQPSKSIDEKTNKSTRQLQSMPQQQPSRKPLPVRVSE